MPRTAALLAAVCVALLVLPTVTQADVPPPSASPAVAAAALWGPDLSLDVVVGGEFALAFPAVVRYEVQEPTSLPWGVHAMLWDGTRGWDATVHMRAMMDNAGALVLTTADALRYGKAAAEVLNVELQPLRQILLASQGPLLGESVADPAAVADAGGFTTTLTTWSPVNGVVLDWTVRFTGGALASATWTVRSTARGPYAPDIHEVVLPAGAQVVTTYSASSSSVTGTVPTPQGPAAAVMPWTLETAPRTLLTNTTRVNFDGSAWVAEYLGGTDPSSETGLLDAAVALTEGGVAAYAAQVARNTATSCSSTVWNPSSTNWTFEATDPDCLLVIEVTTQKALSCGACTNDRFTPNVTIYVAPFFKEYIQAHASYTDPSRHTLAAMGRNVMGHEHVHSLQYAINLTIFDHQFYMEGIARFAETILDADFMDHHSTWWYANPYAHYDPLGTSYFQRNPDLAMCPRDFQATQPSPGSPLQVLRVQHAKDYGLYWGHVYTHDGGMPTLFKFLKAVDARYPAQKPPIGEICDADLDVVITSVLSAAPGGHADHAASLRSFALPVYTKAFSWAPPGSSSATNWGAHLLDVEREPSSPDTHRIGAWALQYVLAPPTGTYDVLVTAPGAAGDWSFQLFEKANNGAVTVKPVTPGTPVRTTTSGKAEVVLSAVRTAPGDASYTARFIPVITVH